MAPWWGRLSEVAFLGRLYDLEALPSTDGRFKTADGDIRQHRVANYDWDDDWVFDDPRFRLASGPDEVLLGFLAQMVHPVVQPVRTGTGDMAAVSFAHETATRIDTEHISQQVTRMEGAVDAEPDVEIGTAKELIESICKDHPR